MSRLSLPCAALLFLALVTPLSPEDSNYVKIDLPQNLATVEVVLNHDLNEQVNVRSLATRYDVVINGGYYQPDRSPSGFLKVHDRIIQKRISDKLNGFIVVNKNSLSIRGRDKVDFDRDEIVMQSGPFLIDPGGIMGIHSNSRVRANRTCLGQTTGGGIFIIHARDMSLYALAEKCLQDLREIDCLLNLDGGPMAGCWTRDIHFNNDQPAINYLAMTLAPPAPRSGL